MAKREELIVGLDIGTTKVCAIVGEVTDEGIDIIGIGSAPSKGLRKGVVINIDATVQSIKRAIEEAELMAGCEISTVYAGIAGGHIQGVNSQGIVAVNKEKEIRDEDLVRVMDAARAVSIPMDREVIHVLPQQYVVDGQSGIKEPLGMSAVRLEAKVHIVTGAATSVQNVLKSCQRCNLHVSEIVLEQLASAEAVLADDEKELGVAIVDIGGGTTDVAIFHDGAIVHSAVLALGGNHLSNDIAMGLRTPIVDAEELKKKYGCAMVAMVSDDDQIEVPTVGGRTPRQISRKILSEIIEPRMEEIMMLVKREIQKSGYGELMASGVVLTGGTAALEGVTELAEDILKLPVRRGQPRGIGGLVDVVRSPMFATGVGLVLHGAKHRPMMEDKPARQKGAFSSIGQKLQDWFRGAF
jgi:cell division protein FtsA